jgi:calcineurin-like phosphoesterase
VLWISGFINVFALCLRMEINRIMCVAGEFIEKFELVGDVVMPSAMDRPFVRLRHLSRTITLKANIELCRF